MFKPGLAEAKAQIPSSSDVEGCRVKALYVPAYTPLRPSASISILRARCLVATSVASGLTFVVEH